MKNISLKIIESKNPGIKIKWLRNLDAHRRSCKFSNFVADENEIFCDKCYRVLLNFCPFCGSDRIEEYKFDYKCSICKAMLNKKFL